MVEMHLHFISQIHTDNQRLYLFIRLRHRLMKILQRARFYPLGIFLKYIQQSIGIMIPILIIDNRNFNRFNIKDS